MFLSEGLKRGKIPGQFPHQTLRIFKNVHPIFPCEYGHYLGMFMEPGGISGLLPHEPSCHCVLYPFGMQNVEMEIIFFEENRKTEENYVFF